RAIAIDPCHTANHWEVTLSLHDALPIYDRSGGASLGRDRQVAPDLHRAGRDLVQTMALSSHSQVHIGVRSRADQYRSVARRLVRSEEHTSELQSLAYLVCRLLLGKKQGR